MNHTIIINKLIEQYNYQTYLEIGTQQGVNYYAVKAPSKVGVDPDPKSNADVYLKSDDFFAQNKNHFDIIFIDGYHEKEQAIRDIDNALKCLNEGGCIVVHDINPTTEEMQQVPRITKQWTGDVWKAWMHFRARKDLFMVAYEGDFGVGVIFRGEQKPKKPRNLTFANFIKNKKTWLNINNDFFK